jgi:putative YhdH/YhfP family quinone oxidoreductase
MVNSSFRALVVSEDVPGHIVRRVQDHTLDDLPPGEVLVAVHYSSLNYKDALSASGNRGVTKRYPHTPGIDAAGIVERSTASAYKPGDAVIIHSADFGANTPGGYSEVARVPADWLIPLPPGMTLRQSMAIGTAGITAALAVMRLQEESVQAHAGDVLVTGATGGVGITAVVLLARLGYRVVAATGKAAAKELLTSLGAAETIDRARISDESSSALLRARWAGVVDTVGGNILSTAIRSTSYGGVVTCCGNVAGANLSMTVYPFILRAVRLIGIDVANCSHELLHKLWHADVHQWPMEQLDGLARECTLDQLDGEIERTLHGQQTGRVIVNLAG